jgi:CNT family concentrative nucleoside transporter
MTDHLLKFGTLTRDPTYASLSSRSLMIATYAVSGFRNISSVGIQIGVLSQLAPGRTGQVAKVVVSALVSGVIATLMSASFAGMLIVDQGSYIQVGK